MKTKLKNIVILLLAGFTLACSKRDVNYKELIKGGEIYYPGVVSNSAYRAGNLRTMLIWKPSPDPNIARYKIFWNNKRDSLVVPAADHLSNDTVRVLVPGLTEGTYSFIVYSIDNKNHSSIPLAINNVRVFGPKYQSGIVNRAYNADEPYVIDIPNQSVLLKFNNIDTGLYNTKTVITYTDNSGAEKSAILLPENSSITLSNYKFGTSVIYQSSYVPIRGAIDTFKVNSATYPAIKRFVDITSLYIKNPGDPFLRSDNGTGKWGLPLDWLYNSNVVNQNGNTAGGWSTDGPHVIHFESRDWSGDGVTNGKIYQTFTLPAGEYAMDFTVQNYGGNGFTVNHLVVAGTTLPDINNIGTTIARFEGTNNNLGGGTRTLTFTLTEATTVAAGWVVNTQTTTYLQYKSVKLKRFE